MKNKKDQVKIMIRNSESETIKGFTASTSSSDFLLFKIIGLKVFHKIPCNIEYYAGEVELENHSTIKVWVYPAPAMFWKFEVYVAETENTVIVSTGSGTLNDFWNSIKLIAEGMLDINYKE